MQAEAHKMSAEAIAYATLAMSERKDFSEKIYQYPLEYVLIHGALDKLVLSSDIESRLISKKQLHIIENAGHMAHMEKGLEVMQILKKLLLQ